MQMTRLLRFNIEDLKITAVDVTPKAAKVVLSYAFTLPTVPDQRLKGEASAAWSLGEDGQWCKDDEPLPLPFPSGAPANSLPPRP